MTNDPLIGKQFSNFKLERPLGRGGMASIYYGTDIVLDRPVAVKVIDSRHRHKPEYVQRLVQEARAVAKWRQENIVQVYYAGSEEDTFYFVMEYIDGVNLRQRFAQIAPDLLPPDEVIRIGRAIASALDYAHARGAIHRDIKPENVMLENDGRIVLTDFGLVIDTDSTQTGESFGSAAYIAPEQARSQVKTVPQSDLYSLGVMLFEMLTGTLPFDDPSAMSTAIQHVSQPPPSPRTFNPALNMQTEAVLLKALDKLPEQRYQTGGDLIDALERALHDTSLAKDDLIGQQFDEYLLKAHLGQGGMARIYRAQDVRLKRDVAIKVIEASLSADKEYRERFEREAQAIAQLSHAHIVNVFRYGEVNGLFYLAMQYIDGSDLRHKLNDMRRAHTYMPLPEVQRIIQQIGSALDYAHSKGIIHRDIKPANILLDESDQIFLSDFGLVLRSDTATRGEVFGSPRYVAPEQAMSSAAAVPQSDLYALGIILYEMLTNQVPFDAKDPLHVAMMQMSDAPPPPRDIRPELSQEIEAVVLKVLKKEPSDRYATGREMAAALAAAIEAEDAAPPVTPVPIVKPPSPPRQEDDVKRPLPPIPAAVVIAEEEPPEEPAVEPDKPQRRRRGCLPLLAILLLLVGLASWYFFLGGDEQAAPYLPANVATKWPGQQPTASSELVPVNETPTVELTALPTETAVPMNEPTSVPTKTAAATATSTSVPTHTPTAEPTSQPTHTPTVPPTDEPSSQPTAEPTAMPTVTREKDGAVMVVIPASTFMMGAVDEDEMAGDAERPLHPITLSSFQIDQFEVTVAQYATFLNDIGGYVGMCNGFTCLSTGFETTSSHLINDTNSGDYIARPGQENTPINNVSWHGADAYCRWAGAALPTEAQWELAARNNDGRLYPWGNDAPDETRAVFNATFDDLQSVDALPQGISPFAVYGLAGSVWEWVADEYNDTFYAESPVENPANISELRVTDRVLRGGGYRSKASEIRSTYRIPGNPIVYQGIPDVGFRCASPRNGN
ncbi:MAG: hypothetical protein CSA11_10595 [Chloroflexi bacterium]|nr:MAG: hypothetical protein CSA11_10595 [Chloroflexota bacterium]